MNIFPGLISGERSFLVGLYRGGPISGWAYKRDGSFVGTKIKQCSQLQNIFYLYNLKTDKIKKISSCSSSQLDRNRDRNSVYTYMLYEKIDQKSCLRQKIKGNK